MDASPALYGTLMPIGGAEDKTDSCAVLARFVALCGGAVARIAVLPTASSIPDVVSAEYHACFTALGAQSVTVLPVAVGEHANDPAVCAALDDASGLFMSGGDQVQLVTVLRDSVLHAQIMQRFADGLVIAGTSAGASAMSRRMIAFGDEGALPVRGMVNLADGLGLLDSVIVDQHFRQRNRLGRLMASVALHPDLLGIGLDEDTALIIRPDGTCEVFGAGLATVVDGGTLVHNGGQRGDAGEPVAVIGMQVHTLTHGYHFDLAQRRPLLPE